MVPPLRGVWASAVAASAKARPAANAIFFNIVFSPPVPACSDRRVDHSQHVERKIKSCRRSLRMWPDGLSLLRCRSLSQNRRAGLLAEARAQTHEAGGAVEAVLCLHQT